MGSFSLEDEKLQKKTEVARETIENIAQNLRYAKQVLARCEKIARRESEISNLYFEDRTTQINKIENFAGRFKSLGSICGMYKNNVDDDFTNAYKRVLEELSDIKSEDITVNNNLGIREDQYVTIPSSSGQYGYITELRSVEKRELTFEDILTYGEVSEIMQFQYNQIKTECEKSGDPYPENFLKYVDALVNAGEFDYEVVPVWKEVVSLAIDVIPIIGDGKALIEAISGKDLITGRELAGVERALCLVSLVPLVGDGIKISGDFVQGGIKLATKSFGKELMINTTFMLGGMAVSEVGVNPITLLLVYQGGRMSAKGIKGLGEFVQNTNIYKNIGDTKIQFKNILKSKGEAITSLIKSVSEHGDSVIIKLKEGIGGVKEIIFRSEELSPFQRYVCFNGCFLEDTLIVTKNGLKKISEIKDNELVLSKSEKSGAIDYKKALLIKKLSKDIINITINGEIIKTTEDHLFMTIEGWKKAIDLKVGEKIITSNNIQNIENIQKVSYNKNIAVYNLEVEEYHTFFVGNSSILVHNEYKMPNLKKMYKEYLGKLPEGVDRKTFENLLNKVEKSGDIKLLEELESKLSNLNGDFSKFDAVVKDFDLVLTRDITQSERLKYYEKLRDGVIEDTAWERLLKYADENNINLNSISWDEKISRINKFKAEIISDLESIKYIEDNANELLKLSDIRLQECIKNGYNPEDYYRILNQDKTIRNPEEYLKSLEDTKLTENWKKEFYGNDSEVVISYMPKDAYENFVLEYGTIGRPGDKGGQFVLPQKVGESIESKLANLGSILNSTEEFKIQLARELGLPENSFVNGVVKVEIPLDSDINLHIVTGIEDGCNYQWIPGGKTLGGVTEGIIRQITRDQDSELFEKIINTVQRNF